MELTHEFTVPASLEETWDAFADIEDVGACFPGAQVTSVEGEEFKGTVKVKLGPIALQYAGTGKFVDRDEEARTFVVEAKGKDKRGNGTASAVVTASMTSLAADSTAVEVKTDLSITGKPAQFGRGVIQDVSDKLLQQFIGCLETKVGAPPAAEEEGAPEETAPAAGAEVPEQVTGERAERRAEQQAGQATARGAGEGAPAGVAGTGTAAPQPTSAGRRKAEPADAIDLGATVLPVLLKTYWRQLAGGVAVLLVLRWLCSRRCRNCRP